MVTFSPKSAFLRVLCWMDGHGGVGLDLRCKKCGARLDPRPKAWRTPPRLYRVLQWVGALTLLTFYGWVIAAAFGVVR